MQVDFYIPKKLPGLIELIWKQCSNTPQKWKILPSGKLELIFRMGPASQMRSARHINDHNSPLHYFCFLSGLHTRPLEIGFDSFYYIGVQMKPIAAKALFGIPVNKIRDFYIEGSNLFTSLNRLEEELNAKSSFVEIAKHLENHLHSMIRESSDLHLALSLDHAVEKITTAAPLNQFDNLERMIGYSRTHTFRLFNDWFGLAPHSVLRLRQFVRSIQLIHQSEGSLTQAGCDAGYYDQPHFIKSFKEFAGMTPKQYQDQMTDMPGQLPV